MPYRKFKRSYRKRPFRRYKKATPKSGMNWASMAKTALKTAKFVKSIVNAEVKHFDIIRAWGAVQPVATWEVTTLNNPAQGTSATTRNGDSIKNKALIVEMEYQQHASASLTFLEQYIIYSKDGSSPTPTKLFSDTAQPWISPRASDYYNDYKIVSARHIIMNAKDFKTSGKASHFVKCFGHTKFIAGTTTIDDGNYWLVTFSNETANFPNVAFNTRFTFYDN